MSSVSVFGAELTPVTTIRQLTGLLGRFERARQSAVIFGEPGIGKSAAVTAMAAEKGRQLFQIHGPHHGPEDFKFPVVSGKVVKWVQSVFPSDPNWDGIVFIDEFGHMPPAVQAALLGLFHNGERRIGTDYVLPEKATVIGASNLLTDGSGSGRTISPLVLRVNKLLFQPNTERSTSGKTFNDEFCSWLDGRAYPGGEDVISFVRCYPHKLHDYDADRVADSPTPRGWAEVAQLLDQTPQPDDDLLVAGKLGPSVAAEFSAHRELTQRIDPLAVVRNPETASVPADQPSLLWATVGAVARVAKNGGPKEHAGILKYLMRCPAEYAVYGVMDSMACGLPLSSTEGGKFVSKFGPLLAAKE